MQWLIVGLGNPGPDYEMTRHNVGFWAIDALAKRCRAPAFRVKFQAEWTQTEISGHAVLLVKPLTFMNLSGQAVQALSQFYKIPPTQVITIHDELDFEPGVIRLKVGGGAGGHNGLKSLIAHIGEPFIRLRVGIGKPPARGVDHVLSRPPAHELRLLEEAIDRLCIGVEKIVQDSVSKATQFLHTTL